MSSWPYLFKQVLRNNFEYQMFEKHQKDMYKTTCQNSTILHFAVLGDNIDLIQYIIDKGVDIDSRNNFEESPIHWCCKEGNLKILKLLIDNGADYNAKDFDGNTPLHWAVEYDQEEMVSYLLSLGVLYDEPNIKQKTPMELAILNSSLKSMSILNAHLTKSFISKDLKILDLKKMWKRSYS